MTIMASHDLREQFGHRVLVLAVVQMTLGGFLVLVSISTYALRPQIGDFAVSQTLQIAAMSGISGLIWIAFGVLGYRKIARAIWYFWIFLFISYGLNMLVVLAFLLFCTLNTDSMTPSIGAMGGGAIISAAIHLAVLSQTTKVLRLAGQIR
jgi:hypothetical protein